MVTHDVQEAVLLADRIAVMGGGHILAEDAPGPLLAVRAPPEVADADGDAAAPGRAHRRTDREGRPWMIASPARSACCRDMPPSTWC